MKNKYGRDLSKPLAPTFEEPKPITKRMADKVTKIAAESNTKLKKQNKAAKKQRRKSNLTKAAATAALVGGILIDRAISRKRDYKDTPKDHGVPGPK